MDEHAHAPFIPAEVLARQARLASVLAAMEQACESHEPAPFRALRDALKSGCEDPLSLVELLASEDLAEEAMALIRAERRRADAALVKALSARLEPLAAKAMTRREAGWHLDSRRAAVRLGYAKEGAALAFDEGDLLAILGQAFRLAGFRLALDLGRRPRPLLWLELSLPAGVGGLCEWAEAVFRTEPPGSPEAVMDGLNQRLPEGLRIHGWEVHPPYATPVTERAKASRWRWECPPERVEAARRRTADFLASETWPWEKGGKVEGQKQVKRVDLRPLVPELWWEGDTLFSLTRMDGAEAANPMKVHGAILGLEPSALQGLVRLSLELGPDPRLAQAERFEPKLKNMYEDAVLLSGGSNITLVDEDDDEPIRLG